MTDLSKTIEEFFAFSSEGKGCHPVRKEVPLFPSRNYRHSSRILRHLLQRPQESARLRSSGFNFGRIVATTVFNLTTDEIVGDVIIRENLPGAHAVEIIYAVPGSLCLDQAKKFEDLFPGSLEQLGFSDSILHEGNFAYLVPMYAKIILWLEVLSFLVLKDYDVSLLEVAA